MTEKSVAYDDAFLKTKTAELRASIGRVISKTEQYDRKLGESSTMTPKDEPNLADKLVESVNNMLDKLLSEIGNIETVGEGILQLDYDLADIATTLNLQVCSKKNNIADISQIECSDNLDEVKTTLEEINTNIDNKLSENNITDEDLVGPRYDNWDKNHEFPIAPGSGKPNIQVDIEDEPGDNKSTAQKVIESVIPKVPSENTAMANGKEEKDNESAIPNVPSEDTVMVDKKEENVEKPQQRSGGTFLGDTIESIKETAGKPSQANKPTRSDEEANKNAATAMTASTVGVAALSGAEGTAPNTEEVASFFSSAKEKIGNLFSNESSKSEIGSGTFMGERADEIKETIENAPAYEGKEASSTYDIGNKGMNAFSGAEGTAPNTEEASSFFSSTKEKIGNLFSNESSKSEIGSGTFMGERADEIKETIENAPAYEGKEASSTYDIGNKGMNAFSGAEGTAPNTEEASSFFNSAKEKIGNLFSNESSKSEIGSGTFMGERADEIKETIENAPAYEGKEASSTYDIGNKGMNAFSGAEGTAPNTEEASSFFSSTKEKIGNLFSNESSKSEIGSGTFMGERADEIKETIENAPAYEGKEASSTYDIGNKGMNAFSGAEGTAPNTEEASSFFNSAKEKIGNLFSNESSKSEIGSGTFMGERADEIKETIENAPAYEGKEASSTYDIGNKGMNALNGAEVNVGNKGESSLFNKAKEFGSNLFSRNKEDIEGGASSEIPENTTESIETIDATSGAAASISQPAGGTYVPEDRTANIELPTKEDIYNKDIEPTTTGKVQIKAEEEKINESVENNKFNDDIIGKTAKTENVSTESELEEIDAITGAAPSVKAPTNDVPVTPSYPSGEYPGVSVTPASTDDVITPSEPEVPVEPTPVVPSEPEVPVEPTPVVPSEPEVPVEPTPVVPSEPEIPVEPTPVVPSEPEVPVEPTPVVPSEPEVPVEPTPVITEPTKPVDPIKPVRPVDPVKPVRPVSPIKPVNPIKPGGVESKPEEIVSPEVPVEVEPEPIITTPEVVEPIPSTVEYNGELVDETPNSGNGSAFGTIGTVAGVGLALGAAAYGVNQAVTKDKDDVHYVYENPEEDEEKESESLEEQYREYTTNEEGLNAFGGEN